MRYALFLVALAGCYGPRPQSWVGSPERELVERWGAPDAAMEAAGGRVLTWRHRWSDGAWRHICTQSFTIQGDTIAGWSYENCPRGFLLWTMPASAASQ